MLITLSRRADGVAPLGVVSHRFNFLRYKGSYDSFQGHLALLSPKSCSVKKWIPGHVNIEFYMHYYITKIRLSFFALPIITGSLQLLHTRAMSL
jgi:hypothetical protein